jgi:hypothetical protein
MDDSVPGQLPARLVCRSDVIAHDPEGERSRPTRDLDLG